MPIYSIEIVCIWPNFEYIDFDSTRGNQKDVMYNFIESNECKILCKWVVSSLVGLLPIISKIGLFNLITSYRSGLENVFLITRTRANCFWDKQNIVLQMILMCHSVDAMIMKIIIAIWLCGWWSIVGSLNSERVQLIN